MQWFSVNKEQ